MYYQNDIAMKVHLIARFDTRVVLYIDPDILDCTGQLRNASLENELADRQMPLYSSGEISSQEGPPNAAKMAKMWVHLNLEA